MSQDNLNQCWANLLIEEFVRNGVNYFCISPGSRSTPLTVAVARNKRAKSMVHFDERASAFHALGYCSSSKKPCALITTSGTAAANLFPGIIEASKKKVPLIILTADRPPELRMTGAHQTIDQVKIFGDYVRLFIDLPTPTRSIKPEFILTTVDQAVFRAKGELGGPVHINCMFREPLEPNRGGPALKKYLSTLKKWMASDHVYTKYVKTDNSPDGSQLMNIADKINRAKQGVIVVGKLTNNKERSSILRLARKINWPVFADVTSLLRFGTDEPFIMHHFDQLLQSTKILRAFKPDCVLHIGGRITSKRWYRFAERLRPDHYIMVINHPLRNDPLHILTDRFQAKPDMLLKRLTNKIKARNMTPIAKSLNKCNAMADDVLNRHMNSGKKIDECHMARIITQQIKQDHALFLASSLSIRLVDMFADKKAHNIPVGSNRGASGIDGTIASACGYMVGLKKPVTLLVGDLAFLYDMNSLAMLKDAEYPMTIIILNNNGGGIFNQLPIKGHKDVFRKYFSTPHDLEFSSVADMFHHDYYRPGSVDGFKNAYNASIRSRKSSIIEVQTNKTADVKAIKDIQSKIIKNINLTI